MIDIKTHLTRWVWRQTAVYLGAGLVVELLILSAPEVTARPRWMAHSTQFSKASNPAAQDEKDVRVLVPGAPIERELSGETHSYRITLTSGQFLRVVVDQRGVAVTVRILGPNGRQLADTTNPTSRQGAERLSLIAEISGDYRIEISSAKRPAVGVAGRYEVRIDELRAAATRDAERVAAERAFAEGRRLQARGEADAFREASKKYQEALPVFREEGDRLREAATLQYLGNVSHNLGDPRAAIRYYMEALSLWRALEDRPGQAQTLNSLGWSHSGLGDLQKALEYYDRALPLWRDLGDLRGEAQAVSAAGAVRESLGDREKALEHYLLALPLIRRAGDRLLEAYTLNNMSWLYLRLDETQKALDHANQALPIWREVKNMAGEATAYHNIASVYDLLVQYEKALEYYDRALKLWQAFGNGYGEAQSLNNIGIIYYYQGEYQKALDCYGRALQFWQTLGNRLEQAETLINIGLINGAVGESKKALENYERALALGRAVGNRNSEATALYNLGVAYVKQGDALKALEYFHQSLALSQTIGNRSREADALAGIANAERRRGNLPEARARMEAALEIIESLRTRIAGQDLRASYFASNKDAYDFHIDLLMQLHELQPSARHDEAALVVSERFRARSLLETLGEARADIRQGAEPELLKREHSLQQQLNAKAERLTHLLGSKHSEEQASAARKEVDSLLTEYQQVQAQIRTESPRYAALTQPQPLSVSEIQHQVLDQNSLLLEYSLGEERSFLWAVTPSSIKSYVLPKQAEIETAARRVYELLNARNQYAAAETSERRATRVDEADAEYAKAAAALSQMLLGAVATQLGRKRLIIVSEGALQYVPFSALPAPGGDAARGRHGETETRGRGDMMSEEASDRRVSVSPRPPVASVPLIVEHEIVTLPSASVLAVLRRELRGRPSAHEALAVLADPVFRSDDPRFRDVEKQERANAANENRMSVSPPRRFAASQTDVESSAKESGVRGFKRLRFSRKEADAISALAPGARNLKAIDFTANRATATSPALSRYRVLHFATHGLLNSQHPELSGIVLSLVDERGNSQDGFLRLHEIYNLKLGADLVVLSACQTALGREIKGEGLVGLTRGFMYAGAPRVVASLWNVDDRATSDLMKRFYRAMFSQSMSPAAALRAAQTSLRAEKGWEAPYYWAAFTLQGEWK